MRNQKSSLYLHNLATTMLQQLRVPQSMSNSQLGPQEIYAQFGDAIKAKLSGMKPETLGRIASCGLPYQAGVKETALYQVHCGSYLGKYESGCNLLTEIAATAIVAEIYDILSYPAFLASQWDNEIEEVAVSED